VYRGSPLETIGTFTDRLLSKWPAARLAKPNEDPTSDEEGTGVIRVTSAQPYHDSFLPGVVRLQFQELFPDSLAVIDNDMDDATGPGVLPGPPNRWNGVPVDIRDGLVHDQVRFFVQDKPVMKRSAKSGNDVLVCWQ
jgi:hypothetical protein